MCVCVCSGNASFRINQKRLLTIYRNRCSSRNHKNKSDFVPPHINIIAVTKLRQRSCQSVKSFDIFPGGIYIQY